jgi:3-deoxy-D-manno-octulosonic-acid transferase
MHNFVEMVNAFIDQGAACEISGADGFTQKAANWLSDSQAAEKAGRAARELVHQNRGSVDKIMEIVTGLYGV